MARGLEIGLAGAVKLRQQKELKYLGGVTLDITFLCGRHVEEIAAKTTRVFMVSLD